LVNTNSEKATQMIKDSSSKYSRAKLKVERIKKFYEHALLFLIVNVVLFWFKGEIFAFFLDQEIHNSEFYNWLALNIIFIPVIWGVILLIHANYAFLGSSKFWKNKFS
tara:strand:+ start:743 stop:1066 length:324 start_codon:yes stop_codon:yes gene_type:complete